MTITVIASNGVAFITDFGESLTGTFNGEEIIIPRYGVWEYDLRGKAQTVWTTNDLDSAKLEYRRLWSRRLR